jgi:trimethylamine:corrinoid methyltransferase-like protein
MRYDEWKTATNASSMGERVQGKLHELLEEYEAPTLPDDLVSEIDKIIKKAEKREAQKNNKEN